MNFFANRASGYLVSMANLKHRFTDNVPGPWYVDAQCICCGLCENVAPDIFRVTNDHDHHRVHHQPATPQELCEAEDARDRCPVEAIGNDGGAIGGPAGR